jgi:PKD repeat protein
MPAIFTRPAKAAQTTNVTISDLAFNPKNVTIKVGSSITWINNDPLIYTLWFVRTKDKTTYTVAGKEGLSDPILPGKSWSQAFNEIVTLQYYSFERLWITGFITVVPLVSPVASFTYAPSEPLVDQTAIFNASESFDIDGNITSYEWDFGDGTNGTGIIRTHIYTQHGTHNVTLTVTDDDGLKGSTSKTVTVLPIRDIAIINVTLSSTEVKIGENVTITVVVKNEGTVAETFTVTVYSNNTAIDTQTVTNLTANSSETIKAEASQITGETDTADNTFTPSVTFTIKKLVQPFIPFPYIILILIIIAIIVLGLGAYFYTTRKKTPED